MKKYLLVFLLCVASAATVPAAELTATFEYPDIVVGIDGFRLYDNNIFLCDETDTKIRRITCPAHLGFGAHVFTMTAFSGNEESPHSNAFPVVIKIKTPKLGTVEVK